MIVTTDAVRIAIYVVTIMAFIACCRLLCYQEHGEIKRVNSYLTWLLVPSLDEPHNARYVNAFATDEEELQALNQL